MFANMKKSKSMDKLYTAEVISTSRDIDMSSPALNSSNESPKKSSKNGKSKTGAPANDAAQIQEPPTRFSSLDLRHVLQDNIIAQFNKPQSVFSEYCNQISDK